MLVLDMMYSKGSFLWPVYTFSLHAALPQTSSVEANLQHLESKCNENCGFAIECGSGQTDSHVRLKSIYLCSFSDVDSLMGLWFRLFLLSGFELGGGGGRGGGVQF